MKITPDILVAYCQCPRKAFLLLFSHEQGSENEYVRIIRMNRIGNQNEFIRKLATVGTRIQSGAINDL